MAAQRSPAAEEPDLLVFHVCVVSARDVPADQVRFARDEVEAEDSDEGGGRGGGRGGRGGRAGWQSQRQAFGAGTEPGRHVFCAEFFGRDAAGRAITVQAQGYTPVFYLKVDGIPDFRDLCRRSGIDVCDAVRKHVSGLLGPDLAKELRGATRKRKSSYFGFEPDGPTDYVMLTFDSERAMRAASIRILKPRPGSGGGALGLAGRARKLTPFDADLEPLSRLLQTLELPSVGWMRLGRVAGQPCDGVARAGAGLQVAAGAGGGLKLEAHYKALGPCKGTRALGPVSVVSFDIECLPRCDSLFPSAQRDYTCVATFLGDCLLSATAAGALSGEEVRALVEAATMACMGFEAPPDTAASAVARKLRSILDAAANFRVYPKPDPDGTAVTGAEVYDTLRRGLSEDVRAFLTEDIEYKRPAAAEQARLPRQPRTSEAPGQRAAEGGGAAGAEVDYEVDDWEDGAGGDGSDDGMEELGGEGLGQAGGGRKARRGGGGGGGGGGRYGGRADGRADGRGGGAGRAGRAMAGRAMAGDGKADDQGGGRLAEVTRLLNESMPPLEGDYVTQVGLVFEVLNLPGAPPPVHCICVLGGCSPIDGAEVECCATEAQLLEAVTRKLAGMDAELVVSYNGFSFDVPYLEGRASELGVSADFSRWSRVRGCPASLRKVNLGNMGEGAAWNCPGRACIDVLGYVRKNYRLRSYKLDAVSRHFLKSEEDAGKHALTARDLFRLQRGGDADRAEVARYCIQDCSLVMRLFKTLRVLPNSAAKAALHYVPLSHVFLRGQGVAGESLLAYFMRKRNVIRETRDRDVQAAQRGDRKVEGATVIPGTGQFQFAVTLDFASLYPNSMLEMGFCSSVKCARDPTGRLDPERYNVVRVVVPCYEGKGTLKRLVSEKAVFFAIERERRSIMCEAVDVLIRTRKDIRRQMTHRRVRTADGTVRVGVYRAGPDGVFVDEVRVADDAGSVVSEPAFTPDELSSMEAQQLSVKVACNSFYGLTAAPRGGLYDPEVAECITATARERLGDVVRFMADPARGIEGLRVVYGDTDSVFVTWVERHPETGAPVSGEECIPSLRRTAMRLEADFNATVAKPHKLEFEKLFLNIMIFKKKRYSGLCFPEGNPPGKMVHMGSQMVRLDTAPITQDCMRVLLDAIIVHGDLHAGLALVMDMVEEVVAGRVALEKLVKSKRLNGARQYVVPPAHKVLALRVARRGTEEAPMAGDNVLYLHVVPSEASRARAAERGKNLLLQDKIETPDFVRREGLRVDYQHYVQKDMFEPMAQVLAVVVESLPGAMPAEHWRNLERMYRSAYSDPTLHRENVEAAVINRITLARKREVHRVLFEPLLARMRNEEEKRRIREVGRQHMLIDFFVATEAADKRSAREAADERGAQAAAGTAAGTARGPAGAKRTRPAGAVKTKRAMQCFMKQRTLEEMVSPVPPVPL